MLALDSAVSLKITVSFEIQCNTHLHQTDVSIVSYNNISNVNVISDIDIKLTSWRAPNVNLANDIGALRRCELYLSILVPLRVR